MLVRTIFENTKNIILLFYENSYCYLNLLFLCFVFFRTKKEKKRKRTKYVFHVFIVLLIFENVKQFSKTVNKQALSLYIIYSHV